MMKRWVLRILRKVTGIIGAIIRNIWATLVVVLLMLVLVLAIVAVMFKQMFAFAERVLAQMIEKLGKPYNSLKNLALTRQ